MKQSIIDFSVIVAIVVGSAACSKPAVSADSAPPSSSAAPVGSGAAASVAAPAASTVSPRVSDRFPTSRGEVALTPIHHASLLLEFAGKAIYLDPTKDGSVEGLPKADWIFVTDVHPDHLDEAGIARVSKEGTVFVGPPAVGALRKLDVVLANGQSKDFGVFSVEAVAAYNLVRGPAPGQLYHTKGRGNGYVLTFGETRIYDSGDTECTSEMRALSHIDVAFVCMNLPYTMTPAEATECANAFKPKVLFPFHYRDSNLDELRPDPPVEVRRRAWY
ncbi:MAG: MBL fold metallo-hydrolase [Polyangiaceae bacterium]|jgi:L-ascorbate metabolism protein UlaG (beta-lactamase superfamily)